MSFYFIDVLTYYVLIVLFGKYVCMYVYFHLVHVIITSNVGIILDVQFIIMYTK